MWTTIGRNRNYRLGVVLILLLVLGLLTVIPLLLGASQMDRVVGAFLFPPQKKLDSKWQPPFPNCEEVSFVTADGSTIFALYFPCENRNGTVLYSHGNGGNVSQWGTDAAQLREKLAVSVLVYDYRGYGKSEGNPTASGVFEDARAARKWLADKENIRETDIIVFGRSLGGAVAIEMAAKDGARALVTESTFASLTEMTAKFTLGMVGKRSLLEKMESIEKIPLYTGPTFMSHGTADSLIPFSQGQRLFDAAGGTPKEFYTVEGGGHNDFPPDDYYPQLYRFLFSSSSEL